MADGSIFISTIRSCDSKEGEALVLRGADRLEEDILRCGTSEEVRRR